LFPVFLIWEKNGETTQTNYKHEHVTEKLTIFLYSSICVQKKSYNYLVIYCFGLPPTNSNPYMITEWNSWKG
jgi:hypothetical protein